MSEEDYDTLIAPRLAEIAKEVSDRGGSFIARVEWENGEAGITHQGVSDKSSVAQRLAAIGALCNGNFDGLCISAIKQFDLSQTMVGTMLKRNET